MLIFTRRVGQAVIIGTDVTVQILGVKGSQVRVGITAPKDIPVHRGEVFERLNREGQSDRLSRAQRSQETPAPLASTRSPARVGGRLSDLEL